MLFPIFCLSKGRGGGITASYPSAYFIEAAAATTDIQL